MRAWEQGCSHLTSSLCSSLVASYPDLPRTREKKLGLGKRGYRLRASEKLARSL